jgi:hypothetical protein
MMDRGKGDVTVGDFASDVLALNHARLADDAGSANTTEIWESLCRIIVMQTGVPRKKITPEAGIDDLDID